MQLIIRKILIIKITTRDLIIIIPIGKITMEINITIIITGTTIMAIGNNKKTSIISSRVNNKIRILILISLKVKTKISHRHQLKIKTMNSLKAILLMEILIRIIWMNINNQIL